MLYALAAVSALMVIPMFAAIYLSEGSSADRPVEDLSFKRMGAQLDSFLGDVEHETDFRNLLDGKTYAERNLKRMIHGSKTSAPGAAASNEKKTSTHKHSDSKHSKPDKASRGALSAQAAAGEESETPLAAHWVQAPPQAKPQRAESGQQQLRALGGPQIIYEASKALRGRVGLSPAALRAHRAHDMRTGFVYVYIRVILLYVLDARTPTHPAAHTHTQTHTHRVLWCRNWQQVPYM